MGRGRSHSADSTESGGRGDRPAASCQSVIILRLENQKTHD